MMGLCVIRIAQRHRAKYLRDNIKVYHHQRHSRRFRRSYRKRHNKERKLLHQENERKMIESMKATCPDQNAINLSTQELSVGEKSLLRKGPSFVPNPIDINWQNLKRDFDNFVNKLHHHASKTTTEVPASNNEHLDSRMISQFGNPPPSTSRSYVNYRKDKTNINSLETFIELVENDIFKPDNYRRIKSNITKEKREALKNIQRDSAQSYRIQDKGSRFVILDNDDYIGKIDYQLRRSSFSKLNDDPSNDFEINVIMWTEEWKRNGVLNDSWSRFIKPSNSTPGKMYGLVKTHKEGNPVRVITSGCGKAIENLSIFVEKCLYFEVLNIECRVQDTSEMLTIIDNLNSSNSLTSDWKLVSFDIINMFPSIDNISGLKSVKKVLESRSN